MGLRLIAATFVAALMVVLPTSAANAACYGDVAAPVIDNGGGELFGGQKLTVTAEQPNGFKGDWTLTLAITGEQATASGTSSIKHTFKTPVVKKRTKTSVTATLKFDDVQCQALAPAGSSTVTPAVWNPADAGSAQNAALAAEIQTVSSTAEVILLPRGQGGGLPNAGGTPLLLLLAGLALAFGGGYGAYRLRR